MRMEEGIDMQAATLERESAPSLRDKLSNSDFSDKQAEVLERAVANLHHFVPSYWMQKFLDAGFTPEQAEILVDTFATHARGQ